MTPTPRTPREEGKYLRWREGPGRDAVCPRCGKTLRMQSVRGHLELMHQVPRGRELSQAVAKVKFPYS